MLGPDEPLGHRAIKKGTKWVEVVVHVEHAARLRVNSELRPGDGLKELIERPEATGEHDEAVAGVGHRTLAFMHRFDDQQLGQSAVRDFLCLKRPSDHSANLPAGIHRGVGKNAHQPDLTTAVDQLNPSACKSLAQGYRGSFERRISTGV
jgi:hypothetical protein